MSQQLDTATLNAIMPFGAHLGLELVEATPGRVVATLAWDEATTTSGGAMHGGCLDGSGRLCGGVVAFPRGSDSRQSLQPYWRIL